jgi:hypothetical protein
VYATVAVCVLATVATAVGLGRPGHYRDAPALVALYRTQDLTVLLVGVPVLAAGLRSAMRGSPRGRVVRLGALAYTTYVFASVSLQVTFNELFLVYVALFGLSLFTFVGGVVTTDADAIRRSVADRLSPSLYAAVLIVIALGLAALWLAEILPALLGGSVPPSVRDAGPQALVTHVLDLGVVVPGVLLSALWLLRRRAWGYVLAGVVLVFGATLSVSIASTTLVLLAEDAATVPPVAALFTFLPVTLAALFAVRYVRSIDGLRDTSGGEDRRQSA